MSRAAVRWISGPVLRATASGPFSMREAVHVGEAALLGEVVRIDGDEAVDISEEHSTAVGSP